MEIRVIVPDEKGVARLVVHVLAAVQEWLADEGIDWAKLWLGFRSYTLVG